MIINLGQQLPAASSDLPGSSGGPPSNAPLHGLAPDGVYLASPVTRGAVSSYLAFSPLPQDKPGAVCFLWHFPWGHPRSPLATILPCGARTFLQPVVGPAIIPPAPARLHSPMTTVTLQQVFVQWGEVKEVGEVKKCKKVGFRIPNYPVTVLSGLRRWPRWRAVGQAFSLRGTCSILPGVETVQRGPGFPP